MKKYIDRLNESAEETAKSNNPLIAEESNLTLQSEQLRCKKDIAVAVNSLDKLKSAHPLDCKAIYTCSNKISLLERELEFYNDLAKELF